MGSEGLTDTVDQLRSWLRSLPIGLDDAEVLVQLGGIAATVAEHLGVGHPEALPTAAPVPVPDVLCTPDVLGTAWETMMCPDERRQKGSHFTPRTVADQVAELAVDRIFSAELPVVWDPTCGGGAFLLAAARALAGRGHDPAEIVRAMYGTDIDPIGLLVTDASLQLWSGGGGRPTVERVDVLERAPETLPVGVASLVVGNPPFLGQLTADTARTDERRDTLVRRFGAAARGYVDDVGLVVLAAAGHSAHDSIVALLTPESLLGATDAMSVREAIVAEGALEAVWVETEGAFDAAVDVVCPIIRTGSTPSRTTVYADATVVELEQPDHSSWSPVLAAAAGVPVLEPRVSGMLGEVASITAGFRQHFYGLHSAVDEAGESPEFDEPVLRLITSGVVDLLWNRWSERPIRFAGKNWRQPIVHLERIEDPKVAEWFEQRRRPKLLVASQTRVIEVVADPDGTCLPSVPVISVEPHDPDDLWRIAAVLASPTASALIASTSAGTGLSRGALRIRAAALADLPLPANVQAWEAGARAAQDAQDAIASGDPVRHRSAIGNLGTHMGVAFGITDDRRLVDWWCDRIRFPDVPEPRVE